jgi:hypothetical protein
MPPPENATGPTVTSGEAGKSSDHHADGVETESTGAEQVAAGIDAAVVAALLDCRTVAAATGILAGISADVPDPLLRWAVRLAGLAVAEGAVPSPAVCAEMARQHNLVPPGCAPLSTLLMLAADPPLPVNVPWLLSRHKANTARRQLESSIERLRDVVWRGDLAELEQVVRAEFWGIRNAFDAAKAVAL